jgi:hypothetical protein
VKLANIPPPGTDGVSLNAVAQIGNWASDAGENSLEATLLAGAGSSMIWRASSGRT